MGPPRFAARDIVLVHYLFSDALKRRAGGETASKLRPALVLFSGDLDDLVLCAITTQAWDEDILTIRITKKNFAEGSLQVDPCYIKPASLFTFTSAEVVRRVARLHPLKFEEVQKALKKLVEDGQAKKSSP